MLDTLLLLSFNPNCCLSLSAGSVYNENVTYCCLCPVHIKKKTYGVKTRDKSCSELKNPKPRFGQTVLSFPA